jgi:hypothetical protein
LKKEVWNIIRVKSFVKIFIRTRFAARVARPLAIEDRSVVDHVMNRDQGRQATFRSTSDYETFF